MTRRVGIAATVLAALTAGAVAESGHARAQTSTSSPSPTASAKATPTPIPANQVCAKLPIKMPPTLDNLPVSREESCTDLKSATRPAAVDAMALYSLRRKDSLLLATLQISRFAANVDASSLAVQHSIITQLSPTVPAVLRVGDTTVYHTQSSTVTLLSWFKGRYLFVLAARDLVGRPRTLLRDALEIRP
jgi:hypothetical protein